MAAQEEIALFVLILVLFVAEAAGDAGWFEFTSYPDVRELCHESVMGRDSKDPMELEWRSYASRDATEKVIAFYAKTGGKDANREGNSITVRQGKDRVLTVQAASASYPGCSEPLG